MNPTPDLTPLRSDQAVSRRVAAMVGHADRQQIWLLLLDEHAVALPVLPVVDLPGSITEREVEGFAHLLEDLLRHDAAQVVVVWELPRSGPERDVWPGMLAAACRRAGVGLRAQAVVTRSGDVRLLTGAGASASA